MGFVADDWLSLAWRQAWQIAAVGLLIGVLSRLCLRNRPQLAYALWLVFLMKCLVPAVWSSPTSLFGWWQWLETGRASTLGSLGAEAPQPLAELTALTPPISAAESLPRDRAPPAEVVATAAIPQPVSRDNFSVPTDYSLTNRQALQFLAGGIWGMGTCLVLAFGVRRRIALSKIARAGDHDVAVSKLVDSLVQRLRARSHPRTVIVDANIGPGVYGVVRPTLILPRSLIGLEWRDRLEGIIAHELIHVRRQDAFVASLQWIAQSIWWFHPVVWWANRRIEIERERSCDVAVIHALDCAPARYAQTLLDVARLTRSRPERLLLGMKPSEEIAHRMRHILQRGSKVPTQAVWLWMIALLFAVLLVPGAGITATQKESWGAPPNSTPVPIEILEDQAMFASNLYEQERNFYAQAKSSVEDLFISLKWTRDAQRRLAVRRKDDNQIKSILEEYATRVNEVLQKEEAKLDVGTGSWVDVTLAQLVALEARTTLSDYYGHSALARNQWQSAIGAAQRHVETADSFFSRGTLTIHGLLHAYARLENARIRLARQEGSVKGHIDAVAERIQRCQKIVDQFGPVGHRQLDYQWSRLDVLEGTVRLAELRNENESKAETLHAYAEAATQLAEKHLQWYQQGRTTLDVLLRALEIQVDARIRSAEVQNDNVKSIGAAKEFRDQCRRIRDKEAAKLNVGTGSFPEYYLAQYWLAVAEEKVHDHQIVVAAAEEPVTKDPKTLELLKEQVSAASEDWTARETLYQQSRCTLDCVVGAAEGLYAAKIRLATETGDKAAITAAAAELVKQAGNLTSIEESRFREGKTSTIQVTMARLMLAKARAAAAELEENKEKAREQRKLAVEEAKRLVEVTDIFYDEGKVWITNLIDTYVELANAEIRLANLDNDPVGEQVAKERLAARFSNAGHNAPNSPWGNGDVLWCEAAHLFVRSEWAGGPLHSERALKEAAEKTNTIVERKGALFADGRATAGDYLYLHLFAWRVRSELAQVQKNVEAAKQAREAFMEACRRVIEARQKELGDETFPAYLKVGLRADESYAKYWLAYAEMNELPSPLLVSSDE